MKHVKSIIGVLTAGSSLIALSAAAQTASPQSAEEAATRVDEVIVLGSRIPRQIDTEGPAPVTTIT